MPLQILTFDEPRFSGLPQNPSDPNFPFVFCGAGGANTLDDRVSPENPLGTGVRIIIAQGNMFLERNPPQRHLFFTKGGNPGCPNDVVQARLVIRFAVSQRFISFRLFSDFSDAGNAPTAVNFFAQENNPPGTVPLHSISITEPFSQLITFNQAGAGVREITITTRSLENTLDDLQFSDTVLTSLRDVAAAFDGSGSMSAQGKWGAMIEAGALFHDIYKALGDPADTFGGVVFRSACGRPGVGDLQITERPQPSPLSNPVDLPALFAADAPQGCTPIGEGVVTAAAMVQAGNNPTKAVLLLTDGINNRGRSVAESSLSPELENVQVFTVGLGTEANIDPVAISALAQAHGGEFRQTTNPAEIADFFVQALSQILGKAELAVVSGDNAVIASGTTKAVFLLAWDIGAPSADFDLRAPDGTVFSFAAPGPAGPVSSISYQAGSGSSFHAFFVVEGADLGGTWAFVGAPSGARRLAVEDLSLTVRWSITPKLGLTGEPIVVKARILMDGKPFAGKAEVRARITSPAGSCGEILAAGGKGFKPSVLQADPNMRNSMALNGQKALKGKGLEARKLAAKTFRRIGKGLYELVLAATDLDGVYRFDLEAESRTGKSAFHRRITLFSVLVSAPAEGGGTARLSPVGQGRFRAVITPITRKQRPLGPFLSPWIRLRSAQGKFQGKVIDHLDGSYSQLLAWDGKGPQSISVEVLGKPFAAGKIVKAAKTKASKPKTKTRGGAKKQR